MKHKAFRWIPAVLLAAVLAGCGAETAPPRKRRRKARGQQTACRTDCRPRRTGQHDGIGNGAGNRKR